MAGEWWQRPLVSRLNHFITGLNHLRPGNRYRKQLRKETHDGFSLSLKNHVAAVARDKTQIHC